MPGLSALYREIPYRPDGADYFAAIADRPWAVFLDSGTPQQRHGRFDILSSDPYQTLVSHGLETTISDSDGNQSTSTECPFQILRQALPSLPSSDLPAPFSGGALGYFSYDLARRIEHLPQLARDEGKLPEMAIGLYDWALVIDHQQQKAWVASPQLHVGTGKLWPQLIDAFSSVKTPASVSEFSVEGEVQSNLAPEDYAQAFARVQAYIQDGDCYQVNLAQRFSVATQGSPWAAYQKLRRLSSAPFGAYLDFPQVQILCNSPERFLSLRDSQVETKPIKGTLPRLVSAAEDLAQVSMLRDSLKDQAENLMIVDLLRNDLSKNCALGSVQVPKLFDVESYATVHHLVSTITGTLAEGADALSLLKGCFPGGSITGTPKLRAMEIIEELEPDRRGVYCGSIGYFGYDGSMDTNIAIRTMTHQQGAMRFWAGGGIVADSRMESEYRETYHKVSAMLELLRA